MKRLFFVLLSVLLCAALVGCSAPRTAGLASAADYGYSVDTAADARAVEARFASTAAYLQSAGLERRALRAQGKENHRLEFRGPGLDVQLALVLPEQGLAKISLEYHYEGSEGAPRHKAERLLARVCDLLSPG